jgi:hypothetical protein
MAEWCMAHPWMTFFIASSAVGVPQRLALAYLNSRVKAKKS